MRTAVQARNFPRNVTVAYCTACHALFGKTISVIAGEAEARGVWYGLMLASAIDAFLREPDHCANQLVYYRRLNRLDT